MALSFPLRLREGWEEPTALLTRCGGSLTQPLRKALAETGSLTRHLERLMGGVVEVRLENQTIHRSWSSDPLVWKGCRSLPEKEGVLIRDAWLEVAGKPCIFAHSEVALTGLEPVIRAEISQGKKPLGTLFLERGGEVGRRQPALALAVAPSLAERLEMASKQIFWCRRSLFYAGGSLRARILEVFLI